MCDGAADNRLAKFEMLGLRGTYSDDDDEVKDPLASDDDDC